MPTSKRCIDCVREAVTTVRPAPHPGPRCTTHDRVEKKRKKAASHDKMVQRVYALAPGDYEKLYQFQGGACALCQRATGKVKRLAVDHDHSTGHVRGLLCGPCNQLLGHGRDDPEFFLRILDYLQWPPYKDMKWIEGAGDDRPGDGTNLNERSPKVPVSATMPDPRTIGSPVQGLAT